MMRSILLMALLGACGGEAVDLSALPFLRRTAKGEPPRQRRLACISLGRIGGLAARERLLELLKETTGVAELDGPLHLYAAVGLTLRRDPATAVDLLNALSTIDPNDPIGALGSEERSEEYFTVDAQIADALLGMGLWGAEEELVEQLRRRHRIRVLIDAYAVLRRHTRKDLRFRYNGSYADRLADADAWLAWLRETRWERERKRPFDASNRHFQRRTRDMVHDLGTASVNNQLIAKKVLRRIGIHAIRYLAEALASDNPVGQRHASFVLGEIGRIEAAPVLRAALGLMDRDARAQVIDALRKLGDRQAHDRIANQLGDKDPEVRASAADYLGALGGPADMAGLNRALSTERAEATRTALLCALVRLGDSDADTKLLEVFRDGEQLDRKAAKDALDVVGEEPLDAVALDTPERRAAAAKRWQRK